MAPRSAAVRHLRDAVAAALADLPSEARVGVACSGGPDSVALLDAAAAVVSAARVLAIHVDHQIHPGSRDTAAAVAAVAARLGIEAEVVRVEVRRGASLEDHARAARYAALDAVAARRGLASVLTAHTARDQAETVLLRILRGTGPAGLAGIPAVRGIYRRPLLELGRDDVERYVAARRLPTIDDPMNDDPRFARVRVRQELVPALARENPRIADALIRLARSAAEWTAAIDAAAAVVIADAAAQATARSPRVPVAALIAAGPAVGKRVIQRLAAPAMLEAEHLEAVWRLVSGARRGSKGVDLPGIRVERVYDEIVVGQGHGQEPGDGITADGPDGPYQIRPWQPGDRMRPARLRGRSRKLSDLYADARVPRAVRARARVVIDRHGTLVWAEHLGAAHGAQVRVIPSDLAE